jgi:catechol 2,3-dioxygenase-like lactoylglutathione lyase family enzyme
VRFCPVQNAAGRFQRIVLQPVNLHASHPFAKRRIFEEGIPSMDIVSLDHLTLTVRDIEKTMRFYVGALGMEPVVADGRYAARFGSQKINFHRKKGEFLPAAQNPGYGNADFCLLVGDTLASVKAQLDAKGIKPETQAVRRNGARGPIESIYLRDPDGNLVEISNYL